MEPYTASFNFEPGKRYRIVHQSSTQRFPRVSVLLYLGTSRSIRYLGTSGAIDLLAFSARPIAGTQQLPRTWIQQVEKVPDSTPASLNKRFIAS